MIPLIMPLSDLHEYMKNNSLSIECNPSRYVIMDISN